MVEGEWEGGQVANPAQLLGGLSALLRRQGDERSDEVKDLPINDVPQEVKDWVQSAGPKQQTIYPNAYHVSSPEVTTYILLGETPANDFKRFNVYAIDVLGNEVIGATSAYYLPSMPSAEPRVGATFTAETQRKQGHATRRVAIVDAVARAWFKHGLDLTSLESHAHRPDED